MKAYMNLDLQIDYYVDKGLVVRDQDSMFLSDRGKSGADDPKL